MIAPPQPEPDFRERRRSRAPMRKCTDIKPNAGAIGHRHNIALSTRRSRFGWHQVGVGVHHLHHKGMGAKGQTGTGECTDQGTAIQKF